MNSAYKNYISIEEIQQALEELKNNHVVARHRKIVITPMAFQMRQFRFPKSRKNRIRQKWAKREINFKRVPAMFKTDYFIYAHPEFYYKLNSDPRIKDKIDAEQYIRFMDGFIRTEIVCS